MTESELDVLRDMRELLTLIAEPQLEARDKKRRDELRRIAGRSEKNIHAIVLMQGSKTQKEIGSEVKMDLGQLSRLVKALNAATLLDSNSSNPRVVIPVSEQMFAQ